MAKNAKEFTYEVKAEYGVIGTKGNVNTELRLVEMNGVEKYDIRPWWEDDKGVEKMGKGIRLTGEELKKLGELINNLEL